MEDIIKQYNRAKKGKRDSRIVGTPLPYKPKQSASSKVDLPAPLSPTIKVVDERLSSIVVNLLPDERRFFHLTVLNVIIDNCVRPELHYTMK